MLLSSGEQGKMAFHRWIKGIFNQPAVQISTYIIEHVSTFIEIPKIANQ